MLSNDKSRCVGKTADATCQHRESCARYTEWINPYHGPSEKVVPVAHWRCSDDKFSQRIPVSNQP